jgi:hypothetical protein
LNRFQRGDHLRQRDEQQRGRHQVGQEDGDAGDVAAREAQPRQRVANQDAAEHRQRGGGDRDDQRVLDPGQEIIQ